MPGHVVFLGGWWIYKGCNDGWVGELLHDFYLRKPINRLTHSPGSVFYFVASLVLSSSIMFSEAA